MPENDGVEGRLGDVSGRLGDVSGRLGDVSGRLGDVSGRASAEVVEEAIFQDRDNDKFRYFEARLERLENELVLLVRWANGQLQTAKTTETPDDLRAAVRKCQSDVDALEQVTKQIRSQLSNPVTPTPNT